MHITLAIEANTQTNLRDFAPHSFDRIEQSFGQKVLVLYNLVHSIYRTCRNSVFVK